jgi:hypothetical protein
VCIGVPYCWQHLRISRHLKITESGFLKTLHHKGRGLYAYGDPNSIVFKKGAEVASYSPAEFMSKTGIDKRYDYSVNGKRMEPTAPYGLRVSQKMYLDNACVRSVATNANSVSNRAERVRANVRIRCGIRNTCYLIANRDIRGGEEIITDYGDDYWGGPQLSISTRYQRIRKRP